MGEDRYVGAAQPARAPVVLVYRRAGRSIAFAVSSRRSTIALRASRSAGAILRCCRRRRINSRITSRARRALTVPASGRHGDAATPRRALRTVATAEYRPVPAPLPARARACTAPVPRCPARTRGPTWSGVRRRRRRESGRVLFLRSGL